MGRLSWIAKGLEANSEGQRERDLKRLVLRMAEGGHEPKNVGCL